MHWPGRGGKSRKRRPKSFHPATWEAWWMVINYLHMCTTTLPHFNAIDTHLISWAPWPHARTQEQDIGELLPTHVPELGATRKKCFCKIFKLTHPTCTGTRLTGATCKKYKKKYQKLVHNRCARCNLCNLYNTFTIILQYFCNTNISKYIKISRKL